MKISALLAILTGLLSVSAPVAQSKYPPPYPREGVTMAFQNERVIVWTGVAGVKSRPTSMHQHVFVTPEQLVVILRSQRYPRLGLALNCTRDTNFAFVLASTRKVLQVVEATLDPAVWEL